MYRECTIQDVANKCGVSIATVSRVLNGSDKVSESTRVKVLTAYNQLRNAGVKKDNYILASFPNLQNPFYANVIKGISDVSAQYGYTVLFYQMENYTSADAYSVLYDMDFITGYIIVHSVPSLEVIDELRFRHPVVMCSEHNALEGVPFVAIDDETSTSVAIKYLLSTGRRKIGLINSSLRNNYALHRERAFRRCLLENGITIREDWVQHVSDVNYDLGVTAAKSILTQSSIPDAIFCVSDVFAAAALNTVKQMGLDVPGDISIVGFDNISMSTITMPALTTVSQPTYQLGAQACNLLIDQIEYPEISHRPVILSTELVVREST